MQWYHIIVLICISFMAPNVEHLYAYLIGISIPYLVKCVFRFLAYFLFRSFIILLLSFKELFFYFGKLSFIRCVSANFFFHVTSVFRFFFFLHADVQLFLHYFLKRHCLFSCSFVKDQICLGLFLGFLICFIDLFLYSFTNTTLS